MNTIPPSPKKLTRSTRDKMVGGVCGGLADYLNLDVAVVRILAVVAALVTGGAAVIVYLIAMFVMPEEGATSPGSPGFGFDPHPRPTDTPHPSPAPQSPAPAPSSPEAPVVPPEEDFR